MQIEQSIWTANDGWKTIKSRNLSLKATIVLVFGTIDEIGKKHHFDEIRKNYPNANIISCSTAGEIVDDRVEDNAIVVTAIYFEKTKLEFINVKTEDLTYYCLNTFPQTITLNASLISGSPNDYTYNWSNGDSTYETLETTELEGVNLSGRIANNESDKFSLVFR